jgi:hypothetical protein
MTLQWTKDDDKRRYTALGINGRVYEVWYSTTAKAWFLYWSDRDADNMGTIGCARRDGAFESARAMEVNNPKESS